MVTIILLILCTLDLSIPIENVHCTRCIFLSLHRICTADTMQCMHALISRIKEITGCHGSIALVCIVHTVHVP